MRIWLECVGAWSGINYAKNEDGNTDSCVGTKSGWTGDAA